TMMYFRALEYGLAELPGKDLRTRAQIDEMVKTHGWPGVHARLQQVDPHAARRIHPNDSQRLQRALEVYLLTGKPLSELQKQTVGDFPYPLLKFAIVPDQREILHERIEQRFQEMLRQGFVEEVRGLSERGDLHAGLPSMRAVGYRQIWPHVAGDESYDRACQNALTATRQLAKRQMTWIRSDPDLVQMSGYPRDISAGIMERLSKNTGHWP
ncbi:MAG: tRNA (adenosine(37)-N6)-dimethylallyltransferase MiaA, partial [Gammaproteobacteria bacterium]|nr:tRNA (adenosine(37)-N6)-dimethylallyltransferase MiaA [Gammaproteobacteria bacterium]